MKIMVFIKFSFQTIKVRMPAKMGIHGLALIKGHMSSSLTNR